MHMRARKGFTLPEILVTVTVFAVLAAVVVPTVLQYASRGDAPSLLAEVDAIKKGVVGFAADVRKYPRQLQQLTTTIATSACAQADTTGSVKSANCDLAAAPYTTSDSTNWRGPYFEGTVSGDTYDTKALGVTFSRTLARCGTNSTFICLRLTDTYTNAQIDELDEKIDGGTGTISADKANGNLIWSNGNDDTPGTAANSIFLKLGVAN